MKSLEHATPEDIEELQAKPWQLQLLQLNSSYIGWETSETFDSWKKGKPSLDDLNECFLFCFDISRKNQDCECCSGSGYSDEAAKIAKSFYSWCSDITDDEYEVLVQNNRVDYKRGNNQRILLTKEEVNAQNRPGSRNLGHDAINRGILIEARTKRLGITKNCSECNGSGFVYIAEEADVSLCLMMFLPRKNRNRTIEIKNIQEEDLPSIFDFLNKARKRNEDRFSLIAKYDFNYKLNDSLEENKTKISGKKL